MAITHNSITSDSRRPVFNTESSDYAIGGSISIFAGPLCDFAELVPRFGPDDDTLGFRKISWRSYTILEMEEHFKCEEVFATTRPW